ncbi:MAG: sulfotransferase family protein [Gammaproteobacteria bacterium]
MDKKLICVTGLPRAGSTLLCQLLGQHPDVYSIGHSSPLLPVLEKMRNALSDSDFLLAQLDVEFELVYQRIMNAYRGFIDGWFAETDRPYVVDKNRGWLRLAEMLEHTGIDYHLLVCVRDLTQVFGSIEAQHAKTRLLEFPDHLDAHGAFARYEKLFDKQGIIGSPLQFINDMQDVQPEAVHRKIHYIPFEYLVNNPVQSMTQIFEWLELTTHAIDPHNLTVRPHESDSYYRFKYRHATHASLRPPKQHRIPARIDKAIREKHKWFFKRFYPQKELSLKKT